MSEPSAARPPAWVTKRDGRLEPFDSDKICQALFAASEALGAPHAFLARELTDAVVHFLSTGDFSTEPTTAQIAEQVAKVVRELGQPALAHAFAQGSGRGARGGPATPLTPTFTFARDEAPDAVARQCLRAYTERVVFSRDLVAAQRDGLLLLAGLETPRALGSALLELPHGPAGAEALWAEVPALCAVAGQGLVLDGPEWHVAAADAPLRPLYREWIRHLPALAQRGMVVNLNAATPPAWARQRDAGPLFVDEALATEPAILALLDGITKGNPDQRWDWHLQARDFTTALQRDRLHTLAQQALDGAPIAFVFDRPRRPLALAEGMDRQHPAVLMEVGLDLDAFLRMPGIDGRAEALRDKLPSLARMAVSAGAQKRKYLRQFAEGTRLARGFLLDRARLAVVPLGLDAVVRSLTGQGAAASPQSLEFAQQLVQQLHTCLQDAGRAAHLDVGLDSPGPGLTALLPPAACRAAGLSCPDAQASPERQLTAAGALHAITGQGTACVLLPGDAEPAPDGLVELLQFAWRRTELVRVQFLRTCQAHKQPEFDM